MSEIRGSAEYRGFVVVFCILKNKRFVKSCRSLLLLMRQVATPPCKPHSGRSKVTVSWWVAGLIGWAQLGAAGCFLG